MTTISQRRTDCFNALVDDFMNSQVRLQCSRCEKYFPKEFITIDDECVEGNKKFCMYCEEDLSHPENIEEELKKNYSSQEIVDAYLSHMETLDPEKDYSEIQGIKYRIEKLTHDSEEDIWENINAYRQ